MGPETRKKRAFLCVLNVDVNFFKEEKEKENNLIADRRFPPT